MLPLIFVIGGPFEYNRWRCANYGLASLLDDKCNHYNKDNRCRYFRSTRRKMVKHDALFPFNLEEIQRKITSIKSSPSFNTPRHDDIRETSSKCGRRENKTVLVTFFWAKHKYFHLTNSAIPLYVSLSLSRQGNFGLPRTRDVIIPFVRLLDRKGGPALAAQATAIEVIK